MVDAAIRGFSGEIRAGTKIGLLLLLLTVNSGELLLDPLLLLLLLEVLLLLLLTGSGFRGSVYRGLALRPG